MKIVNNKKYRYVFKGFLGLILIALLLGACSFYGTSLTPTATLDTSNEISYDLALVGKEGCKPPCWNNITPGETDLEETTAFFQQMEILGQGNFRNTPPYLLWRNNSGTNYSLHVKDESIVWIDIPITETTLGGVIHLFGEPGGYKAIGEADSGFFRLEIYFPSDGLILTAAWGEMRRLNSIEPDIFPEMEVTHVRFIAPAPDFNTMVTEYYSFFEEPASLTQVFYEWQGYGEIPLP